MNAIVGYLSGLIFGIGLHISGMTVPENIKAFLTLDANWQPYLLGVMVGAIAVYSTGYHIIKLKMKKSINGCELDTFKNKKVDKDLMTGAMIFGFGWGLAGICPGPAVAALPLLAPKILVYILALTFGMWLFHRIRKDS